MTVLARWTSRIVAWRSSRSAVIGLLDQGRQHLGVAADPLEGPGQGGRGGFVSGGQQGQQFVADVLARHGRTVVVGAAQHQREHVGPIGEVRVGPFVVDQLVDDDVVLAAPFGQPAPRTVTAIGPLRFGQRGQARTQRDPRRDEPAQLVEFGAVGPEYRAQDGVERDAHHRRQRRERLPLRPVRDFAQRLFFDDAFVVLHALAVERRRQQPSPATVLIAVEREYRAGAEQPAQVGLDVAELVGAGGEDLLGQLRVGDQQRRGRRPGC